jgi:murein DD-endopeptidase MepM/ murein hydrolase activator NlpD
VVALVSLALPGVAHAYGWPLKPFDQIHPLRGSLDDPRFHVGLNLKTYANFHFGLDIAAPDGTPVYAVEPGTAVRGPQMISVRRPNRRVFGYWHIRPVVRTGEHVKLHQLVGYIAQGWGHVHFAESVAGTYRNPLRKGALTPYKDPNVPMVDAISVEHIEGHALQSMGAGAISGVVAFVADAYELPSIEPLAPWNRCHLVPSLVRWRIIPADGDPPGPWLVAADFRNRLLPNTMFANIYAPGTYQNKPNRPGDYRFWLTQSFDTASMPDGSYFIEVQASNEAGLTGDDMLPITIANST